MGVAMGVAWRLISPMLKVAARSYVAGPELRDAVDAAQAIKAHGFATFIDYWNPVDEPAPVIADAYLAIVEAVADQSLDAYVSMKTPPLGFRHDLLRCIADAARRRGVGLHFDAMGAEAADETLRIVDELRLVHEEIAFTIPARWRRSRGDADWAARRGIAVRAVKGRWADGEGAEMQTPEASFLQLIERLAGRVPQVAVATHDPALAAEALHRLRKTDTRAELELALGLPLSESIAVAQRAGVTVRLCIPYGWATTPYGSPALRSQAKSWWWLLKDQWSAARVTLHGGAAAHPRLPRAH